MIHKIKNKIKIKNGHQIEISRPKMHQNMDKSNNLYLVLIYSYLRVKNR